MNLNQTLILGDLSGLQDYLFDVAAEGGGQARRLRARSLSISLLAECARRAASSIQSVGRDGNWYFSSAGKFLLAGPCLKGASTRNGQDQVIKHTRWC